MMADALIEKLKQLLSTAADLADIKRGAEKVEDAEAEVREAMAILDARNQNLTLVRQKERRTR